MQAPEIIVNYVNVDEAMPPRHFNQGNTAENDLVFSSLLVGNPETVRQKRTATSALGSSGSTGGSLRNHRNMAQSHYSWIPKQCMARPHPVETSTYPDRMDYLERWVNIENFQFAVAYPLYVTAVTVAPAA